MVDDRAERVVGVLAGRRLLDRLGDGDAEASRRRRVPLEHRAAEVRAIRRRRRDLRAPRLHQRPAVGLLVVGDAHHVDEDLDVEERAGEGERRPPLPGAGLGGEAADALGGVVVRLRHRGVRLVRARGGDALVFEEDPRRGVECLLQAVGAVERRRPPHPVDVADGVGDVDPAVRRHLLHDDRHREQGGEVGRAHRLEGGGVEERAERLGEVREDVVPAVGKLVLAEKDLLHGALLVPRRTTWTERIPLLGPPAHGDDLHLAEAAGGGDPHRVAGAVADQRLAHR